jgi:hypothetical protein
MAVPIGGGKQTSSLESQELRTRQLMKCLAQHGPTFQWISKHPQVGMFHRHTEEWAFLLAYLESEVARCYTEARQFVRPERVGQGPASESTLSEGLEEKMMLLQKFLKLHGMYYTQSSLYASISCIITSRGS